MSDNIKDCDGKTNNICLEFEFTESDYIEALEKHLEKSKYMVWLAPLVGLLALSLAYICVLSLFEVMGVITLPLSIPMAIIILLSILAACILLAVFFRRRARAARTVRKALRRRVIDPKVFGRQKLELKENCIEQHCACSCIRRAYTDIKKIVEYPDGIVLYDQAMQLIVIPSTAFEDKQQQVKFLRQIQNRVYRAQNAGIPEVSDAGHEQDVDCTLQFAWDEPGFVVAMTKANRLIFKTPLGWPPRQIISVLAGLLLIFGGSWCLLSDPVGAGSDTYIFLGLMGILCLAAGFGLFGNLILVFTPAIKRTIKAQIERGDYSRDYFHLQSIHLYEDKIVELRRQNTFELRYSAVHCIRCDERCVYLLIEGQKVLIIPTTAFSSKSQQLDFVEYIEKKIRLTKQKI